MAELKHYDAIVNGRETTLRLSDADAKKRGLTESAPKAPATKKATTRKSTGAKKATAPANKASSAQGDK